MRIAHHLDFGQLPQMKVEQGEGERQRKQGHRGMLGGNERLIKGQTSRKKPSSGPFGPFPAALASLFHHGVPLTRRQPGSRRAPRGFSAGLGRREKQPQRGQNSVEVPLHEGRGAGVVAMGRIAFPRAPGGLGHRSRGPQQQIGQEDQAPPALQDWQGGGLKGYQQQSLRTETQQMLVVEAPLVGLDGLARAHLVTASAHDHQPSGALEAKWAVSSNPGRLPSAG